MESAIDSFKTILADLYGGLRARFLLATLVLVLVVLGGFVYAIDRYLELAESQSIEVYLVHNMDWFEHAYRLNSSATPPPRHDLRYFVVPTDEISRLPEALRTLEPDVPRERRLPPDNIEAAAIRRDVDGHSLFLVQSIQRIETLEAHLAVVAWSLAGGALLLAIVLGIWLSNLVIRPVRRLAGDIRAAIPGAPRGAISTISRDPSIRQIAESFEDVLIRFDAFAARERHFTEDASHELRTPLAVILNAAELMTGEPGLDARSAARLKRILTAGRHMRDMIELLLYLAREDGGGQAHQANVADILAHVCSDFQDEWGTVSLRVHLDIRARPIVNAPAGAIASIAANLIRNAGEHAASARGVDVTLTRASLTVRDYGAAPTQTERSHMFDRNFSTRNTAGKGLGLNICSRICTHFNWTLGHKPADGGGSLFEVRFAPAEAE